METSNPEKNPEKHFDHNVVDKKIAEAKLDVCQQTLNNFLKFAGAVLAVFGVILPLWLTDRTSERVDTEMERIEKHLALEVDRFREASNRSAEMLNSQMAFVRNDINGKYTEQTQEVAAASIKVDNAVKDMQAKFKELAGDQLRKPRIECLFGSSGLQGSTLNFYPYNDDVYIQVKNTGDAPARNLSLQFYTTFKERCELIGRSWETLKVSDEAGYKCGLETSTSYLDAKQSIFVKLHVFNDRVEAGEYHTLLKVNYEQPEEQRYNFVIKINKTAPVEKTQH